MTMSKAAQSGLRTIKRDFSASTAPASSQEIYWPPTPQPQPEIGQLTGIQRRLKAIQDALGEKAVPSESSQPLLESKVVNKRPSPETYPAHATKKPRQLPPSWQDKDPLSAPSLSSRSSSGSHGTASRRPVPPGSSSIPQVSSSSTSTLAATKPKIPAVFLSQEQTQILQLVKDGKSIFYTGSAGQSNGAYDVTVPRQKPFSLYFKGTGKSVLLREIIKTLRRKHVKSPDAVAITASTGSFSPKSSHLNCSCPGQG